MKARAMRVRARAGQGSAARRLSLRRLFHSVVESVIEQDRARWNAFMQSCEAASGHWDEFIGHSTEHFFQVGDYATRDGSDVQLVERVVSLFADFKCIKAPRTGWTEVGEVEHNMMRRYSPLSADEARAMIEAHS